MNIKRQSKGVRGAEPLGRCCSLWWQPGVLPGYNDFELEHEILALLYSQREDVDWVK